ncbi:MAG: aminomethyltransferase family protein [bacterium]
MSKKSLQASWSLSDDWQLPTFFTSVQEEYNAAKKSVALMERSYLGQLRISGNDHADLLHRMTTNELRNLKTGEGQINLFTTEKGRIVDRVVLLKSDGQIRLLTSRGNARKISDWIARYTFIEEVETEILSAFGMLAIFGPKSIELLNDLMKTNVSKLPEWHFREFAWQGQSVLVVRTGELTVPGFLFVIASSSLDPFWDFLLATGQRFDLKPMGEQAYETLRIEAGWPLYGKDFDGEKNPNEAGMLPYVNFDKGCYIGQEVVARLDTYEKVQKHLLGIVLDGDVQPNARDLIYLNDEEVGYLTSVTHSFDFGKNIALGYVRRKFINEGGRVCVRCGEDETSGTLVKLPFSMVKSK